MEQNRAEEEGEVDTFLSPEVHRRMLGSFAKYESMPEVARKLCECTSLAISRAVSQNNNLSDLDLISTS